MGAALYAAAHKRNDFLSFALGLESAQCFCRDWHQGTCCRHGRRLRPLARRSIRACSTERLYARRESGTRSGLRQLPDPHSRPRKRSEGAGGCEGGQGVYFDCRHFMPGAEAAWPQFDYYTIHPERLKTIVATLGMEHMGGRQTVEAGPGGNNYVYSSELPENGGVITSLMDVYNNNIWLVEAIAKAATDHHWPRVDVKAGNVEPGLNGGFQGSVKSPMNKGRAYKIPGIGLAGDWPGGWTQTYAQLDTEAGPHGFDREYFVQQVAGLSQLTGELMQVKPLVIDLGWGELKSALVNLPDSA